MARFYGRCLLEHATPQLISDLAEISFATVIHDTRPTDDFQVRDLRQLGQDIVLHAIDKGCIVFCLPISNY